MRLIYFRKSLQQSTLRVLAAFFLVIVLAACGSSAPTTSFPLRLHHGSTADKPTMAPTTIPPISSPIFNLNAANITEDAGDLRIQSDFGFQCPYSPYSVPMDQLVLISGHTTYSEDEIAQMGAYIGDNFAAWRFLSEGTNPPPTLRWVLGGSMDSIPGTYPIKNGYYSCGTELNLTNTGDTPIQVLQAGVQLEERPQPNTYQYRLIDACTVIPKSQVDLNGCTPSQGGNPGCGVYTASIQLGLGEQNDIFSAIPSAGDCGPLTIAPAAQTYLIFDFSFALNTPKNLIYSIKPILTLSTAQGEQTFALSRLVSTLAFANVNQFSCYGLQGTTFVLEQSPVYSQNLWCM